ncbi:MAG: lipopolysaccharide biosynthesis protein [Ferruginibacter sp.]|nr:lipopolysaccharide biosynthesis protein [Ferruginibacter sp.]
MSQIRRQSIISTIIIFIGFAIGFFNNLFFTKTGWFSPDQYGLTRSFFDFSQIINAYSFLGLSAVIYKFSPYYKAHLNDKENDLLSWALLFSVIGFLLFLTGGIVFKSFFERKFFVNSRILVDYYYWIYPFGFSLLIFGILESYCWSLKRTVISNFLRETALRLLTSALIILFIFRMISFDTFIKLFACIYGILVTILLVYLKQKGQLHFTFKVSKVTRRFRKKMITFGAFVFAGVAISTTAALSDSLTISSKIGQAAIGIFAFSTYISNIIQVPQRSVIAISIPVLSEAWREKNYAAISTLYKRSSINLLLISLFLFGNIWLCYDDGIKALNLNPIFLEGKFVVLFYGLKLIVDMGTGVNGQIIATSNFWRFEFLTGIILLLLIAPMNYFLIGRIGIVGAGISNFVAYTVYNIIRLVFLWKKFKMQPFSINTLWAIIMAPTLFAVTYFVTQQLEGWAGIFCKGILYSSTFIVCVWYSKLTPDSAPVINTLKKKLGIRSAQ